jgi:hypothetical protein
MVVFVNSNMLSPEELQCRRKLGFQGIGVLQLPATEERTTLLQQHPIESLVLRLLEQRFEQPVGQRAALRGEKLETPIGNPKGLPIQGFHCLHLRHESKPAGKHGDPMVMTLDWTVRHQEHAF